MLFGTDTKAGLGISYSYAYDGAIPTWGSADRDNSKVYSVSSISNSAESVDNAYQISNLQITFIDHEGSIWTDLGHGTTCLNKNISFKAYTGGSYAYSNNKFKLIDYSVGQQFPLHSGKIVKVSRKDRLVTIESKSKVRLLGELAWNYPYTNSTYEFSSLGTFFFKAGNLFGTTPDLSAAPLNANDHGDEFDIIARVATVSYPDFASYHTLGRGTDTMSAATNFAYMGSQFTWDFPKVSLKGTYLGKFDGTVGRVGTDLNPTDIDNANKQAQEFGFGDYNSANSTATKTSSGTWIFVNKTRLSYAGSTVIGSHFTFQQGKMIMRGNPATVFKELLTGAMVWPYFTAADIDSSTYADFVRLTTFQEFSSKLDPTEDKVLNSFKSLVESNIALFTVTANDMFQVIPYSPRLLNELIPSFGSSEIISSEISNNIEDYKNRIIVNYAYDPDTSSYRKTQEGSTSGWTHDNDLVLQIDSRWLTDDNEAHVYLVRLINRHANGIPRVSATLPLTQLGVSLGSLYRFTDQDSDTIEKVIQVTSYDKDISESREVTIEGWDAVALYQRKGFAFWGTIGTIPSTGDSNSPAIWGTMINGHNNNDGVGTGTAYGINTAIRGTVNVWF